MKNILLIDFGSTYTKVTAVEIEKELLLGTASSYTTVETDINKGLANALELLTKKIGHVEFAERFACSSAAGGLRMMACGLVPELTAEAAKQASLGAGAKVIKVYSYELTEDDVEEIEETKPEIFLLVGGTDGGNSECILHNAEMLSQCKVDFPVVIAGNRGAARRCEDILAQRQTYVVENVMPKFGILNIEPAQKQIREIFLQRIVKAKGLSQAKELISGIMMPTPSAMMKAMEILAKGCEGEKGIGDLIGIDVGGATTDIYSIADGFPKGASIVYKGLPEPYIKRTVDGDIGMRYSIKGIVEAVGIKRIAELSNLSIDRAEQLIEELATNTEKLPDTEELFALDFALASFAIETAVIRHSGTIEQVYTPCGLTYVQTGKDLTEVKQIVVTGGSLIHTKRTNEIASYALFDDSLPGSLRPKEANILIDRSYVLAAMGLLSEHYPLTAIRIMKKELKQDGGEYGNQK